MLMKKIVPDLNAPSRKHLDDVEVRLHPFMFSIYTAWK
jgi:hypothetical protein